MLQEIGKKVIIFDGAMGTELQKKGISLGQLPEELNITNPQIICDIHRMYDLAGADVLSTNTFGANRYKLQHSKYSVEEIVSSAIENIRSVSKKPIVLDIGPIGQLLEPMGTLSFDEAYDIYKEIIISAGNRVDAILFETMTDIYELRAAVLAAKENSSLPVIASMTFEENGRTLTGTTPEIMVSVLTGLNVDALGVNCSLGPIELQPIVKRILVNSTLPVIIQPNAGLPVLHNGVSTYTISKEEYVKAVTPMVYDGVAIVGGCCGTSPDFISLLAKEFHGYDVSKKIIQPKTNVTSATNYVTFDTTVVCGERLNPTGKKKLKQAIIDEDYEQIVLEGIKQEEAGADVLDVNVGVPKIDEQRIMVNVIKKLQEVVNVPLQIDASDSKTIEKAVRYYNGKPLINSVNGNMATMESIFPIVKKYGGVVIGLTLDENGVPKTAEERLQIAKKIVDTASRYGIAKHDLIIDCLVLTASAEQSLVNETLKAVRLVTEELGVHTALGVSNVSFGLPNRPLLNRTFLAAALANGLKMPIINPLDKEMMDVVSAFAVLQNKDIDCVKYIATQAESSEQAMPISQHSLRQAILYGLKDEAEQLTIKELDSKDPLSIINDILIFTLNDIGKAFEAGKIFLPQLIQSAEAAKISFGVISKKFKPSSGVKGPIILATVKGDIHDIGKNIVKVVLESYGFKVIDLGRDVDVEKIVTAYHTHHPKMIGLSALMTTTVLSMEETITQLKSISGMCPIFVGGAVLTPDVALAIKADYYAKDALESAKLCERIIQGE